MKWFGRAGINVRVPIDIIILLLLLPMSSSSSSFSCSSAENLIVAHRTRTLLDPRAHFGTSSSSIVAVVSSCGANIGDDVMGFVGTLNRSVFGICEGRWVRAEGCKGEIYMREILLKDHKGQVPSFFQDHIFIFRNHSLHVST